MSLQNTDWSQFLQDEPEMHPDVEFCFLENSDEENMKTNEEKEENIYNYTNIILLRIDNNACVMRN